LELLSHLIREAFQHRVRDKQVFLGRDRVLEQAVGDDHVGPMQLLDRAQALPGEPAVVDDELELEDADVGAGAARTRRHGLHVAQPAVKRHEGAFERPDDVGRGKSADEQDRVALNLGDVHAALQAAHHRVEQFVEDRPAVLDLGLGDELRIARDVGQHQCAFLQARELRVRAHGVA
jgi:hypothetical protein